MFDVKFTWWIIDVIDLLLHVAIYLPTRSDAVPFTVFKSPAWSKVHVFRHVYRAFAFCDTAEINVDIFTWRFGKNGFQAVFSKIVGHRNLIAFFVGTEINITVHFFVRRRINRNFRTFLGAVRFQPSSRFFEVLSRCKVHIHRVFFVVGDRFRTWRVSWEFLTRGDKVHVYWSLFFSHSDRTHGDVILTWIPSRWRRRFLQRNKLTNVWFIWQGALIGPQ